jgi:hypothetical protein
MDGNGKKRNKRREKVTTHHAVGNKKRNGE